MYVRIKGNKTIYRLIGHTYPDKPVPKERRDKAILLDLQTLEVLYEAKDRVEQCMDRPEHVDPKEFN